MLDAKGATLEPHSCMSRLGTWVGGWVGGWPGGCQTPPPPGGGGHLSLCGYATILGGWVPELTPPPLGWVSKTLTTARAAHMGSCLGPFVKGDVE